MQNNTFFHSFVMSILSLESNCDILSDVIFCQNLKEVTDVSFQYF